MIHTRNQLVDWIERNVDDRVIANAMQDGEVWLVGAFAPLPTSCNSGWLVKVTTRFHTTHLIAVTESRSRLGRFYWFRAPYVEWANYIGDVSADPLFAGDKPNDCAKFKAQVKELNSIIARNDSTYSPTDRRHADARKADRQSDGERDQDV